MTHYAAINHSTRISPADFADMCEAIDIGLKSYAADLGRLPSTVTPVASAAAVPAGYVPAHLLGPADVPGAGGYHDVDVNGNPYIKSFADIYLDHGGVPIASTQAEFDTSVLSAFSHEFFETEGDPPCNLYAAINKNKETALERCDACEDIGWPVTLKSGRVCFISSYLLDTWFNPLNKKGPFDKTKTIKRAMSLSPFGGGYMIMQALRGAPTQFTGDASSSVEDEEPFDPSGTEEPARVHVVGNTRVIAGPKMPLWKLEHKLLHGRIGRRIHKHGGIVAPNATPAA